MSIIKNTPNFLKRSKEPFTTLLNSVINAIKDPVALGIYCLLSSKSEGWEINSPFLMNHFSIGRDACNRSLKYLKQLGLLVTSPIRDKKGKIVAWETELKNKLNENEFFIQNTENQYSSAEVLPNTGKDLSRILKNQSVGLPECGKSAPINKRKKEIKELNEKEKEKEKEKSSSGELIQFQKQKKKENKEMSYKETYFPMPENKLEEEKSNLPIVANNLSRSNSTELARKSLHAMYSISTAHMNDFEEFWSIYPMKKQKLRVEQIWYSQGCHENAREIIDKLKEQVSKDAHFLTGYIPSPQNYLLESRWEDEVFENKNAKSHFDYKDNSWALKSKRDIFDEVK